MKHPALLAILLLVSTAALAVQPSLYQHGTVIRMRMAECDARHGFMAGFGPPQGAASIETCPEYTLLSDRVVYVIVGKSSGQLVPLAEEVDFRFDRNELAVRVDDARKESKFTIREMVLRSQWELVQRHMEVQMRDGK